MDRPTLIIGNKNYSSWSFRAWLGLKVLGFEFDEQIEQVGLPGGNDRIRRQAPGALIPVLVHEGFVVWESLAILEYVADLAPQLGMWPQALRSRARARSMAHEMHAGFSALRRECPVNMRRAPSPIEVSDAVHSEVARIESMWAEALDASGGPFLFGEFCAADAMYAPVVNRFDIYALSSSSHVKVYSAAMQELPQWKAWVDAARAESWVIDAAEL